MSFDLLRSAKHIRGLSNAEFRVLFYLLEAANNKDHKCFPSIKKIAHFTDMAERTVQRHISALADRGLFARIEQRRDDGSRMVNCYQFLIGGTVKIGKESVVMIGPDEDDDAEYQPANNGTLHNPPFQTGGGDNPDTTPRQSRRDIDQESEPGISIPPTPDGVGTPTEDLFGIQLPKATAKKPLLEAVEEEWAKLVAEEPGISGIGVLSEARKVKIRARAAEVVKDQRRKGAITDERAVWSQIFLAIRSSTFLCGRAPPGKGRTSPFKLGIDYVLRQSEFFRIWEGQYDDDARTRNRTFDSRDGREYGPAEQSLRSSLASLGASKGRRAAG